MREAFDSLFLGAGFGVISALLFFAALLILVKFIEVLDWIGRIPLSVVLAGSVIVLSIKFLF